MHNVPDDGRNNSVVRASMSYPPTIRTAKIQIGLEDIILLSSSGPGKVKDGQEGQSKV